MIITIDGPSGTGKTTIAALVAQKLKMVYFDTGAMYRAAAYSLQKEHIDWKTRELLEEFLESFAFAVEEISGEKRYFVNTEDVTEAIRSSEISKLASLVSREKILREALVSKQRLFGSHGNVVFEGRDMGTVVFPEADVKIFLTATAHERAKRRMLELQNKGIEISFTKVLQEVEERDHLDTSRKISPLKKADDAIVIDTTNLSIEEVVDEVIHIVGK